MAKINSKDVQMINHKLNVVYLPDDNIEGYEMVSFKNGIARYAPKTEHLVVKHWSRIQRGTPKIEYSLFRIQRDVLSGSIESLIKH